MTAQPPGLRRTPPPLRRLFGPLLPLPDGAVWSVGRFRCIACPPAAPDAPGRKPRCLAPADGDGTLQKGPLP